MNLNLKGRVALVTGSTHGLGRSIATALAREGADIIICGRKLAHLEETLIDINSIVGNNVNIRCCGLGEVSPSYVKSIFSGIVKEVGQLDILVNNVGGAEKFGGFFDLSDKDWKAAYELNFMSMVYFSREAIPWLKKSKAGRIINIASLPAQEPGQFNPHYSAAKAAMLNLSKHLANALAKENILVNAICPGTLKGGGWIGNVFDRADRLQISLQEAEMSMEKEEKLKVPLGRIGKLDDIAKMAAFLASDKADFITGACINIDGGRRRSI